MNPYTTSVQYDTKTRMYHGTIKDNTTNTIIYTPPPNIDLNLLQEELKEFLEKYTSNLANPRPRKCCGR